MSTQNTQVPLTPDILKKLEYHHCKKVMEALGGFTDVNPVILDSFRFYLHERTLLYKLILECIRGHRDRMELKTVFEKFKSYHDGFFSNSASTSLSNHLVDKKICGVEPQYRSVWYKDIDELIEFVPKFIEEYSTFESFDFKKEPRERVAQFVEHKKKVIQLAAPVYRLDIDLDDLNSHDPEVVYDAVIRSLILLTIAAARSV